MAGYKLVEPGFESFCSLGIPQPIHCGPWINRNIYALTPEIRSESLLRSVILGALNCSLCIMRWRLYYGQSSKCCDANADRNTEVVGLQQNLSQTRARKPFVSNQERSLEDEQASTLTHFEAESRRIASGL